jgi:hypothetical protein
MSSEVAEAKARALAIEEAPDDDFMDTPPLAGSREAQAAPVGYDEVRRSPEPEETRSVEDATPPAPKDAAPTKTEEAPKDAEPVAAAPAAPAPPAETPKKILGRFASDEEASQYLGRMDENHGAVVAAIRELHTAVQGLMARPATGEPKKVEPPPPPSRKLTELLTRLSIGDDEVTDESLVEALLPGLKAKGLDVEAIREAVLTKVAEARQDDAYRTQLSDMETQFFSAHPDLKALGESARPHLKLLTARVVETLAPEARRGTFKTETEYFARLFTDVATQARTLFRIQEPDAPAGGKPAAPASGAAKDRSGRFSEGSGGPRAGGPVAMSDQEKEISEVFG